MKHLEVTNIQRGCVYDGPGVRTTIFFRGCLFKCPWCCNPENIYIDKKYFIDESKCLKNKGVESRLCNSCERNDGSSPLVDCPFGVTTNIINEYIIDDLVYEIMKDRTIFELSSGGVTLSGGEPLLHVDCLIELCKKLKDNNINIWVESTLCLKTNDLESIIPYIDGVILDLKLQRENHRQTSEYITLIKENIDLLIHYNILLTYRIVFVNSLCDDIEFVVDSLNQLRVKQIEILPCHNLGENKYRKLELPYTKFSYLKSKLELFEEVLSSNLIKFKTLYI